MALQHGSMSDPSGITISGHLLHELRTRIEDVAVESLSADGTFSAGQGKSIRKTTRRTMSGEALSTISLPTVGSGTATSGSPHIDSTELTEKNEGAADFVVEAHDHASGNGDY